MIFTHTLGYSLQPVSSPSEHSLFSVRSVASSSSSFTSLNDKLSSGLNLGKKFKQALSRSNSVNGDQQRKFISNPVPITQIPDRKGSVDLQYGHHESYSSLEQSLKSNTNYYFHHDRSHSVPEEHSIKEEDEEEEEMAEEDDDFYFTNDPKESVVLPFDSIFNTLDSKDTSPVLPLKIKRSSVLDNRMSTASTITPSTPLATKRQSTTYRSSRIILNKLKINPVTSQAEISLFSPTKQDFAVSEERTNAIVGRNVNDDYEINDMCKANDYAASILGQVFKKKGSFKMQNWI